MSRHSTRVRHVRHAALCLLALLALAPRPARAAAAQPFTLTGAAQVLGNPLAPGGSAFTLSGTAAPPGPYVGPGHVQFAYVGTALTSTGSVTVVAAEGALFTAFAAVQDPQTGEFFGFFLVTGGTGRFAGAHGGGYLTATPTGATTFAIVEDGTVIY